MGSGRARNQSNLPPGHVRVGRRLHKILKSEASLSGGRATAKESHRKIRGTGRDGGKGSEKPQTRTTEQHQNRAGRAERVCLSVPIYQIPSVFFRELVERDRGFRMILMSWLLLCTRLHV